MYIISPMETDRLKYFCTIAETGSLTKAADLLGISHSGLSKAISTLEDELQCKLFRPQGRGLEITDEGRRAYQKALEVLASVDRLRLKSTIAETPVKKIGLPEILAISCSGNLAAELEGRVSIFQMNPGDIEGRILDGGIDFAIAFIPVPKPEMEYLKIGVVRFGAFARKDLIEKFPDTEIPFIVPASDLPANPMNDRHRDGWPLGVHRNVFFVANSFSISLNLARQGIGASYMASFIAQENNALLPAKYHLKELSDFAEARMVRPVYLVKSKNTEETQDMKRAAKVIRQLCCAKS